MIKTSAKLLHKGSKGKYKQDSYPKMCNIIDTTMKKSGGSHDGFRSHRGHQRINGSHKTTR